MMKIISCLRNQIADAGLPEYPYVVRHLGSSIKNSSSRWRAWWHLHIHYRPDVWKPDNAFVGLRNERSKKQYLKFAPLPPLFSTHTFNAGGLQKLGTTLASTFSALAPRNLQRYCTTERVMGLRLRLRQRLELSSGSAQLDTEGARLSNKDMDPIPRNSPQRTWGWPSLLGFWIAEAFSISMYQGMNDITSTRTSKRASCLNGPLTYLCMRR